eukprot:snap_masked-scaffold_31-processed-gene-3.48-mRNA-1 protein AED:0.16 eAED:0.17 QI:0/-1/0/1/-1/1/1/0/113
MSTAVSKRVVDLYRKFCREIPRMCTVYDLDYTEAEVRSIIRKKFDTTFSSLTDPKTVNVIIHEHEEDLDEIQKQFKTKSHLLYWLGDHEVKQNRLPKFSQESAFLKSFYADGL